MIARFGFAAPARIEFGRGAAAAALEAAPGLGARAFVVTGATPARAAWATDGLAAAGLAVEGFATPAEPTVAMAREAVAAARAFRADLVIAVGGGAALDLGKAVAGLLNEDGDVMDHLEVIGAGRPLTAAPPPLIALPTTAGTGAEATRNAVLGSPEHGRKVSLRDARLLPALAVVDPALTDGAPWSVTLASGLDALTQVIEPWLSPAATPMTDALCIAAIPRALAALPRLRAAEDPAARDEMAWVSLCGGLALANAKLGAVHGLAGVVGGRAGAPHGAVCGALLGPTLAANRAALAGRGPAAARLETVCGMIAAALGGAPGDAPATLAAWARDAGLPTLAAMGVDPADHAAVAEASAASSSMKGNPVALPPEVLAGILAAA